jgi:hypothetical protein
VGGAARILHQAASLAEDDAAAAARKHAAHAEVLRAEADRALRKAQVLAAGGFPEEVPALLAKAIGHAGAARLASTGEFTDDATLSTPARVRELVEQKLMPLQAIATLEVVAPAGGTPSLSSGVIEHLLTATAEVVAACADGVEVVG